LLPGRKLFSMKRKYSFSKDVDKTFYLRDDVVAIARDLIGTWLFTRTQEGLTGGMIIETEAYAGVQDRASHAYGGRRTKRTEVMYQEGGIAYVYDVKGKFKENCNAEMVDLDNCGLDDKNELFTMIQKHYELTGSTVARFVLDDLNNQLQHFIKVFPKDYKRVLQQQMAVGVKAS